VSRRYGRVKKLRFQIDLVCVASVTCFRPTTSFASATAQSGVGGSIYSTGKAVGRTASGRAGAEIPGRLTAPIGRTR